MATAAATAAAAAEAMAAAAAALLLSLRIMQISSHVRIILCVRFSATLPARSLILRCKRHPATGLLLFLRLYLPASLRILRRDTRGRRFTGGHTTGSLLPPESGDGDRVHLPQPVIPRPDQTALTRSNKFFFFFSRTCLLQ